MKTQKSAEIAALNDQFRSGGNPALGQVLVTPGIAALPLADLFAISHAVRSFAAFTEDNNPYGEHDFRSFAAFTEDNNPYGEHDFGSFDHAGHKVFWKIDYYNRTLDGGSEDPADPVKTRRVLTIMLAAEY